MIARTMTATSTTETTSSPSRASSLVSLVDGRARYPEISVYLDSLSPDARVEQMLSVTGKRVAALYDLVAGGPPVRIADFLPEGLKDGEMAIFEGRNSLPAFTRFQKRFVRKGKDVVGYNHQISAVPTGLFTGPGYFVTLDGDETHPDELLFDYTITPPFFPSQFPAYKPNESGLSRLVYANMKDYCRRVARGVVVGEAFKNGKRENAWFSLSSRR
jgi:hypothetical protein